MIYLRTAELADVETIFEWRYETARWLASAYGSDQWSTSYPRERLEHWVAQQCTLMGALEPGGAPVATITVSPQGDPSLWTPEELAVPAWYLFKANSMIRGQQIGRLLFEWVRHRAVDAVDVLRLDVWSTNQRLQDYYRTRLEARYLRTVPGTTSGALFELDVHPVPDVTEQVCAEGITGWLAPDQP
ncbi:MAG: hypothetical protein QG671_1307 [Actinomycetota bacterium]|nr:hypothetical protein [Actinomycetota bacterium]